MTMSSVIMCYVIVLIVHHMRIKTYVRNVCQHNYFPIQHCHFVNSTQISDVIKILRFGKSDGIDNFKHGTGYFFHCCY